MSVNPQVKFDTLMSEPLKVVPLKVETDMSRRMEHILKAMPSGVVILNGDGIVTEANPVAMTLLGEPLLALRWIDIINRAFSPQKDDGHEVSLRNGRRVKLAMTPLSPEPGQLIVLTDLTETRLLQQNLSHLQRLSALGKMVANLAHQVRTPLSAALLYASHLGSRKITDEARLRFQSKLVDRLNELEHQVNGMLFMAKGRQQDTQTEVSFSSVMQSVLDNCEPIAMKQGCKIQYLNEVTSSVKANVLSLSSAINNLVINSVEAGSKHIQLHCYQEKSTLYLVVIDDGRGLDEQMQKKVLEPFVTTKAQGTGLGLAVVHSVINQHGGTMKLNCLEGKGCQVTLSLPLSTAHEILHEES